MTRRPLVVVVRSKPLAAIAGYVPARWQAVNRRALRSTDAVICISRGLVPAVEAAGVSPAAVHVVLNAWKSTA